MADALVYQTAWRATVLTAIVFVIGVLAAVAIAALRRRRSHASRPASKPVPVAPPMVRSK
jgi:hypothetical protein